MTVPAPSNIPLTIDFEDAKLFLELLDPNTDQHTFVTFDDHVLSDGTKRKDPRLTRELHGTLAQHQDELARLNAQGAGVFVTVNRTNLKGRRKSDIVGVRAIWCEHDGGRGASLSYAFPPDAIVVTSEDRGQNVHAYWFVDFQMSPEEHAAFMRTMVVEHGSDPAAADLSRVMRLPGFNHMKRGPQLVRIIGGRMLDNECNCYTLDELFKAFPPAYREPRVATASSSREFNQRKAEQALKFVSVDEYHQWITVGQALYHATEGSHEGLALWDKCSQKSPKYKGFEDCKAKWETFGQNAGGDPAKLVTMGSVYRLAHENGWTGLPFDPRDHLTDMTNALADIRSQAQPAQQALSARDCLEYPSDLSLDEIVRRPANAVVKGLLAPSELAMIYGGSTAGKSFLGIDMAWHIALGRPWHGRKTRQAAVLYVALEGVYGFQTRMIAARSVHGDPGKHFARCTLSVTLVKDQSGTAGAAKIIEAYKFLLAESGAGCGVIIIDTLARAIAGQDENAADAMMGFIEHRIGAILKATGAAMVIVHHTNKAGSIRGSSSIVAAFDSVIRVDRYTPLLEPIAGKADVPPYERRAVAEKVKDGREGPLFEFELEQVRLGLDPDGDEVTSCVVRRTDQDGGARQAVLQQAILTLVKDREDGGNPITTGDNQHGVVNTLVKERPELAEDGKDLKVELQEALRRLLADKRIRETKAERAKKGGPVPVFAIAHADSLSPPSEAPQELQKN